jgi:hypothetical protein
VSVCPNEMIQSYIYTNPGACLFLWGRLLILGLQFYFIIFCLLLVGPTSLPGASLMVRWVFLYFLVENDCLKLQNFNIFSLCAPSEAPYLVQGVDVLANV